MIFEQFFMLHALLVIFFFQAEDGIRDTSVTGVQTCALPISRRPSACPNAPNKGANSATDRNIAPKANSPASRSEERRVGKECRSRWSANPYKKYGKCKDIEGGRK